MGSSHHSYYSTLEAIAIGEELAHKKLEYTYTENNRSGDHILYVSNVNKFKSHYPEWEYKYSLRNILEEISEAQIEHL